MRSYKTLCKLKKNILIKDNYSGDTMTVDDAIILVNDRWTDYDGELYPFHILDKYGEPDLYQDMTKEFADIFVKDFEILPITLETNGEKKK
jgi:hypothetical protein